MEKEKPWLKTRLIIEIAGFPDTHVNETLKLVAQKFGENSKEIRVLNKIVREAQKVSMTKDKPIEESKFFSGFIEIEAEVKSFADIVGIIFDWMPSSIEIAEPETIEENVQSINGLLNDLCARLHHYDAVIKKMKAKNVVLTKELKLHKPEDSSSKETD